MCGLAGLYLLAHGGVDPSVLRRMSAAIVHRGPDDHDVWSMENIGLAHQRLSILDLGARGRQPMQSQDGCAVLAFNGEIYNFGELRRQLQAEGVVFRTRTDTEVIVEGYRRWGDAILQRLNGMFAIALVDIPAKRLLLARDRFGVKPLYFARNDSGWVFGSEIKAILASGLSERNVDPAAVSEYLHYSGALGERTFFRAVRRLEPGQALSVDPDGEATFAFATAIPEYSVDDEPVVAAEKVRELLSSAVERQLAADVPVGVFLSGGVDSSAIAALASRCLHRPVQTYSADFAFADDQSELARARRVARHIGAEHHELRVEPGNLVELVQSLVSAHDQPFGDAANIPIYLLCRQLNGTPKVILQGDGGDELFAGYPRYPRLARQWLYRALGRVALPLASVIPKRTKAFRALRTLHAMGCAPSELRAARLMSQEPFGSEPLAMLSADWRACVEKHDPFARYREMYYRFQDLDPVQAMLYTDVSVILPDIYFEKVDRGSMANSIEVRVPMMDNALAEYALSLPSRTKLSGNRQKAVLKRALSGLVPDDVLYGRKYGFGVPVSRWLRGPLSDYLRQVLFDDSMRRAGLFDRVELERRVDQHICGRADHGQSLYKMLNLAVWWQAYQA